MALSPDDLDFDFAALLNEPEPANDPSADAHTHDPTDDDDAPLNEYKNHILNIMPLA